MASAAHSPAISVAMSVYNGERFLAAAIESVLGQTFGDFEFLILDDGSTDATASILRCYERVDSRIRPIVRENRGLVASLNELLAATKGASNRLINAQDLSENEIKLIHQFYCLLAEKARLDSDLGETHSVEEAEDNHHEKLAAHRE